MPRLQAKRQIARQWEILRELARCRAGLSAPELAEALDLDLRTVYRDLEILQAYGPQITDSPRPGEAPGAARRFRLNELDWQSFTSLGVDELTALVQSARAALAQGGGVHGDLLQGAADKLAALVDARDVERVDERLEVLTASERGAHPYRELERASLLQALREAALRRQALRFRYHATQSGAATREVHPYGLREAPTGAYLISFDFEKADTRIFLIDRIQTLEPLPPASGREAPPLDIEAYFQHSMGVNVGGERVSIVGVAEPGVAQYLRERRWHPSLRFEELGEGRLRFRLEVLDNAETRGWLRMWGGGLTLEAPGALVEAFAEEAADALARYRRAPLPPEDARPEPRLRRE